MVKAEDGETALDYLGVLNLITQIPKSREVLAIVRERKVRDMRPCYL